MRSRSARVRPTRRRRDDKRRVPRTHAQRATRPRLTFRPTPPPLFPLRAPQVDAQLPLTEGGSVDFKSSDGFKKAKATLSPAFDASVKAYDVEVPAGTSHVVIAATSFAAAVKINGRPGNMSSVDVRPDAGVASVVVTLESSPGVVVNEYVLTPKFSAAAADDAVEVKFEKPAVDPADAAPHTHTHGGVPCTADHSQDDHGHSHDGGKTQCHEDHGHGHGHGEKKEEHGHSHDCGKTECHEDHGHGHGHGEKKEEHGHGHGHGH